MSKRRDGKKVGYLDPKVCSGAPVGETPVAVGFFLPGNDTVTILGTLLQRVKTLGIQVNRLFLDKGFASIDVVDYLTQKALSALIACPIRGRTGGTRALCKGTRAT